MTKKPICIHCGWHWLHHDGGKCPAGGKRFKGRAQVCPDREESGQDPVVSGHPDTENVRLDPVREEKPYCKGFLDGVQQFDDPYESGYAHT
jgi:hypothetical protein